VWIEAIERETMNTNQAPPRTYKLSRGQLAIVIASAALIVYTIMGVFANPAIAGGNNHGHDKKAVCHPVNGLGETKTGWDIISPDKASSHIDESLYPNGHYWKHESKDGRHDVYAVSISGVWTCPGGSNTTSTPTTTTPPTTTTTPPTSTTTSTEHKLGLSLSVEGCVGGEQTAVVVGKLTGMVDSVDYTANQTPDTAPLPNPVDEEGNFQLLARSTGLHTVTVKGSDGSSISDTVNVGGCPPPSTTTTTTPPSSTTTGHTTGTPTGTKTTSSTPSKTTSSSPHKTTSAPAPVTTSSSSSLTRPSIAETEQPDMAVASANTSPRNPNSGLPWGTGVAFVIALMGAAVGGGKLVVARVRGHKAQH
jgi:hypothetical protein